MSRSWYKICNNNDLWRLKCEENHYGEYKKGWVAWEQDGWGGVGWGDKWGGVGGVMGGVEIETQSSLNEGNNMPTLDFKTTDAEGLFAVVIFCLSSVLHCMSLFPVQNCT